MRFAIEESSSPSPRGFGLPVAVLDRSACSAYAYSGPMDCLASPGAGS